MPALDVVRAELATGLRRVAGARLKADLPIRQAVLDEVLHLVPGVPADLAVEIGAGRQLQIRYGVFHASGRLAPRFTGDQPVLVVELASQLVAWGLQRLRLPPFVRVSGRQVEVHLARVPALAALLPLWRHVDAVHFDSVQGRLHIHLDVHVVPEST